jgi:hypothetical protein
VLRVGDARRLMVVELRRVLPSQRRHDAREHDRQPVSAGVHDARVAQSGEQLGPALDGLLARRHGPLDRGRDRGVLGVRRGARLQVRVL